MAAVRPRASLPAARAASCRTARLFPAGKSSMRLHELRRGPTPHLHAHILQDAHGIAAALPHLAVASRPLLVAAGVTGGADSRGGWRIKGKGIEGERSGWHSLAAQSAATSDSEVRARLHPSPHLSGRKRTATQTLFFSAPPSYCTSCVIAAAYYAVSRTQELAAVDRAPRLPDSASGGRWRPTGGWAAGQAGTGERPVRLNNCCPRSSGALPAAPVQRRSRRARETGRTRRHKDSERSADRCYPIRMHYRCNSGGKPETRGKSFSVPCWR